MRRYELTDAQWRQVGWIDRLLQALPICLDAAGHIDGDLWCVDGSSVRAHGSAVGGGKKRGYARTGGSRMGPQPRRLGHHNPGGG